MANEPIKVFKTSILGGFDRRDVIDYVKTLSAERNTYKTQLGELRAGLDAANAELEITRAELLRVQATCAAAVANANAMADEVTALVRTDAREKIERAEAEAETARRELREYKIHAIEDASERLRELEDGIHTLQERLGGER